MSGQIDGDDFDVNIRPVLKIMAKDILRQKTRLGGDFAVAQAVVSRESRDLLRKHMGPDLVFIILNLTKECQTKRINKRHAGEEQKFFADLLHKMFDAYQPAGDDEENSYNVTIDETLTPDDVMKKVLDVVSIHGKNQPHCKEGYWTFGESKSMLNMIEGDKMSCKNIVCLDYPEIQGSFTLNVKYGDFGEAKKEVAEASGVSRYNVNFKGAWFGLSGCLNDDGTKIWLWGFSNKLETWEWITPTQLQALKDDRDDFFAPR